MAEIPVPGRPSETIEALNDNEIDDLISDPYDDIPESWAFSLACEVKQRRAADLTSADCDALATLHFEVSERRRNYDAMLQSFRKAGADSAVIETYERSVAKCDEALRLVERLRGDHG